MDKAVMPRPEKHVFVCTQSRPPGNPRGSCGDRGCQAVYEEFLVQLQNRNLFDRIQVTATGCMGPCSVGPTVLVYPEGVMYAGVGKDDVGEIYDRHLERGEPIRRLRMKPEFWG
jgi:(2Fe-2S) ferredoxin